ncbi:GNAT family N-acetyltransferase [Flaviflexus massiliensis]|uniref:GNAT family N-acetyltransferase n=1 Tax=Flaviflexus massiliensis TaxID=1522309 RepID=UPI0009EB22F5|nr:GNAT family N-acetyltransferase [Flaviflexus massiliensis]
MEYRELTEHDGELLQVATLGTFNWSFPRFSLTDIELNPDLSKYAAFHPTRGDFGFVADQDGTAAGLVWALKLSGADAGYGHVDNEIPEIGLWVHPQYRRQGIATKLLSLAQDHARARKLPGLSLSVEPKNHARKIYEDMGFHEVRRDTAITMVWRLHDHPLTHQPFPSPVPAGMGWPNDLADQSTTRARTPAGVRRLAKTAANLEELDARVSVCGACPRLVRWREDVAIEKRAAFKSEPYWGRPVPGWGDPDAQTLIVGLAPAAHGANRTGRIFTGDRSGDWLFAALHRAGFANQQHSNTAGDGLVLSNVRITSPVHCAPPQNKPTTEEKAACAPWLDRELEMLAPQLEAIVALGGIGWAQVITTARRIGWEVPKPAPKFGHGAEAALLTGNRPIRLIGCYHVSQQNTFTGKLTTEMLDEIMSRLPAPKNS